jgi:hypothetical protein
LALFGTDQSRDRIRRRPAANAPRGKAGVDIVAQANNNYGSPTVTNKYNPLLIADNGLGTRPQCQALFGIRIDSLANAGVYPGQLFLYHTDWHFPRDDKTPPLVVISSGRSQWMADKLNGEPTKPIGQLGYNDPETFTKGFLLWYSPKRSGRRLFVVVHHTEYAAYQAKLKNFKRVTVFGWKFHTNHAAAELVGFGASRFAALALAKILGFQKIWTVDDNVVQINTFPAGGLAAIENRMPTPTPVPADDQAVWAIGFRGASKNQANLASVIDEADFEAPANPDYAAGEKPLQQVVLWNISKMGSSNKNIIPWFIGSNEDVSITQYFKQKAYTAPELDAFQVIKIEPEPDTAAQNAGLAQLSARRTALLTVLGAAETTLRVSTGIGQPVPIQIYVENDADNAPFHGTPARQTGENSLMTRCRCLEQVFSAAVAQGFVPDNDIFTPPAAAAPVERKASQI